MHLVKRLCVAALLVAAPGCGSSGTVDVSGTVKLNGQPLSGALVTFRPEGATGDLGGAGKTDAEGKYTLTAVRGGKGVLPGEYRVIVSKRLNPDGSEPDPKTPPIESQARETLPAVYSDRNATTLRATVSNEARVHDFPLEKQQGP
jgi:hypothetical protein